ncbi:predicted protein, partial [Postia placenta Mad-698-R]
MPVLRLGNNQIPGTMKQDANPLGPFIEALVGVSFSIYPTLGYLNLNIGPQKSLFHCPGNLADTMLANRQESTTMFKRLRVRVKRPGMDPSSIIVTRVANATARQSPMIDSNMTVEDYFRTTMISLSLNLGRGSLSLKNFATFFP